MGKHRLNRCTMTEAARRYTWRMAVAAVLYTAAVIGVNLIDAQAELAQPVRIALSLLPVLPAILMLVAIITFYRAMDEVQQRVISESTIVAALVVGFASFTWGFLEGAMTLPDISLIWVLPALIGVQGLAMPFIRRRYQ